MDTISLVASLLAAMSLGVTGHRALAAEFYASRPIRLVVPSGVIESPGNKPEEVGRIIRADIEKWGTVLRGSRIKIS